MVLTKSDLIGAGISPKKVDLYLPHLLTYLPASNIDTFLRVCHFVSQTAHESIRYTATVENLNYSAEALVKTWPTRFYMSLAGQLIGTVDKPIKNKEGKYSAVLFARKPELIGNYVYANRMGNGDPSTGQGYRYRGRSLIQSTGLNMYIETTRFARNLGFNVDYVNHPELMEQPEGAVLAACYYWSSRNLNVYADKDNGLAIGQIINLGSVPKKNPLSTFPNGYKDRVDLLKQAKVAFRAL